MPDSKEKSALKRARISAGDADSDTKKPRRSQRISSQMQSQDGYSQMAVQLPSPVTKGSSSTEYKVGTVSPPGGRPSQLRHRTPVSSSPTPNTGLTSPPSDTQPFSQKPARGYSYEVADEEGEGVWGYLVPLDHKFGETLVLRRRIACPLPGTNKLSTGSGRKKAGKYDYEKQEENYEADKVKGIPAGGYLIGRHPECDRVLPVATVSNRHCLLFAESKGGENVAILEDLSGNGTFVNEAYVGRNKRRELRDGDEIAVLDEARFVFRYPKSRDIHGFRQEYHVQEQLGKGHFATVYLCVERSTGMKFAVKKFERKSGPGAKSQVEGLQQEIGVLMSVSHPNVLCLKDTYDESDGVYLVLELAPEGELFNWIVMKSKLTEQETRHVFIQLFQGVKYLHDRNIVHRDIKPENILLADRNLHVKLADFGLAKIIGEESFTTTLCGTPSYVAPEILEPTNHRRYTRLVDVWSLGVVLYICLCGFPPFSDELYSPENPYNLSDQIKMGRFDYPSPYWDPVSDAALDLIDRMLTVDVDQRISIDECLEHPWVTQRLQAATDSAESITGGISDLDFSSRKPARERTMLSAVNDVKVSHLVEMPQGEPPAKVFEKNQLMMDPGAAKKGAKPATQKSAKSNGVSKNGKSKPGKDMAGGDPDQFAQFGNRGAEQPLFGNDATSVYVPHSQQ